LREWADWHQRHEALFPETTPEWRLAYAKKFGEQISAPTFRSRPPRGAIEPRHLLDVISAMRTLQGDADAGYPLEVVRSFYCVGAEKTCKRFSLSRTRMKELRLQGELALKLQMKALARY
jgi:hypothetical protein